MKKTKKTLVERILDLKPSEAIELLIAVNKNPIVSLNQDIWGKVQEGICYGCSATNALLKLSNLESEEDICNTLSFRDNLHEVANKYKGYQKNLTDLDGYAIQAFERSINALRCGRFTDFLNLYPYLQKKEIEIETVFSSTAQAIRKEGKKVIISYVYLPIIDNHNPLESKGIEKLNLFKSLLEYVKL